MTLKEEGYSSFDNSTQSFLRQQSSCTVVQVLIDNIFSKNFMFLPDYTLNKMFVGFV